MPDSYPYIISNNKIEPILAKIRSAARPERFSRELLNKYGFGASNDRAMINVLKELGFLTEAGVPIEALGLHRASMISRCRAISSCTPGFFHRSKSIGSRTLSETGYARLAEAGENVYHAC